MFYFRNKELEDDSSSRLKPRGLSSQNLWKNGLCSLPKHKFTDPRVVKGLNKPGARGLQMIYMLLGLEKIQKDPAWRQNPAWEDNPATSTSTLHDPSISSSTFRHPYVNDPEKSSMFKEDKSINKIKTFRPTLRVTRKLGGYCRGYGTQVSSWR